MASVTFWATSPNDRVRSISKESQKVWQYASRGFGRVKGARGEPRILVARVCKN